MPVSPLMVKKKAEEVEEQAFEEEEALEIEEEGEEEEDFPSLGEEVVVA
jgi:hypothetical protein